MDPRRLLTLVACLVALVGCPSSAPDEKASEPKAFAVYAVNYPLAYFAERLSPGGVVVSFPAPADVDPAYWQPDPETIVAFQGANLILLNGAGYARWTRTATLPQSAKVVTADGCRNAFLRGESTAVHRHGPEGEHSHTGMAFTTWLDFGLAGCQAGHVRDALVRALPESSEEIEAKFATLERDLRELDEAMRKAATPPSDKPLFASHPVYQYLGDAYGLSLRSFHFEPDQALDADALGRVDSALNSARASTMLWEAEPLPATRKALEARGIQIVVFEPAGNRPTEGDFLEVMRGNVEALRCATATEGCR